MLNSSQQLDPVGRVYIYIYIYMYVYIHTRSLKDNSNCLGLVKQLIDIDRIDKSLASRMPTSRFSFRLRVGVVSKKKGERKKLFRHPRGLLAL